MFILVSHAGLADLLASPALLTQLWPAAAADIILMVGVLVVSATLAQALGLRLFSLITPGMHALPSEVALAIGSVVLTAFALDTNGDRLPDAHSRTDRVVGLEILDVAVGGVSALRVAG